MTMCHYILLFCFAVSVLTASAQELTVKQMTAAGNDISASQYRVNDINGQPCGLVKVQLAAEGVKFEGNIIPPVKNDAGEYWVYMTAGSKELRVKGSGFVACHIVFSDFGISRIESLQTYNLTLLMPAGGKETVTTQKLVINYSPSNATVLIDSKLYTGNGTVEAMLPVGTHNYIIAAEGYETIEGVAKLTANAPRIINETLIAVAGEQRLQAEPASDSYEENFTDSMLFDFQQYADKYSWTFTVNDVTFKMIMVDGGTFTMGGTPEQGNEVYSNELPAHQVTLSSFCIGETEVTQALWKAVMGNNPSYHSSSDSLPVEMVSWADCQTFIKRLNRITHRKFRLPTEAEWEFAARGGNRSNGYRYSGSNNLDNVGWYTKSLDDDGLSTQPVKQKRPNELGLYDMSGNVREACSDFYAPYSRESQVNPTGPVTGSEYVNRGGAWFFVDKASRVSRRDYNGLNDKNHNLGFRLAF